MIDDTFSTYSCDLELFADLGLETFCADNHTEVYCGEHKSEQGSVKVWCHGMPAQFWRFEIFCKDNGKTTKVNTGSGCLKDYWSMVEKIMAGMFVIQD